MQLRMRPNVTIKTDSKPPKALPPDLVEVSLLDIGDVCAAVRMSPSWWHYEVRAGRAPQPLRYGPRCTRWRTADVRQYLIERAALPQAQAAELVTARAKKASEAARAKRVKALAESALQK